jgi:hypothetical protein
MTPMTLAGTLTIADSAREPARADVARGAAAAWRFFT